MSTDSVKNHKDAFVSALAEFRKVSNELSDAVIGLVGAIDKGGLFSDDEKHEIIRFTNAFSGNSSAAAPKLSGSSADAAVSTSGEETKAGKKQKKKRETDPDQPKRPLPLVLEYLNAEKKRIREQRAADQEPALEMNELNTLARKAWDEVPDAEKNKLIANHEQRVSKYQTELTAYKAKKEAGGETAETAPAAPPSPKPKEETDESIKKRKKDSSVEKKDKKRKKKSKESKDASE